MTRKKVRLALFEKESERRVSFRKRKKGIIKKLDEVTTLCDVEALAIFSSPFEASIEVWPSHERLHRVLDRFRNMSLTSQTKKMYNQETFTKERILKSSEQLSTLVLDNRRSEMDQIINQYIATGNLEYQNDPQLLNDIDVALRQNLLEVNMRIKSLMGGNLVQGPNTGGTTIGEGSLAGGPMTPENITNVPNIMESGLVEEPTFPNDDAP